MGMAAHQLVAHMAGYITQRELAVYRRHLRLKHHLQQHIAQFLGELVEVLSTMFALLVCCQRIKCFYRLVSFLDQILLDRLMGLLPIPGATVRPLQPAGYIYQRIQ